MPLENQGALFVHRASWLEHVNIIISGERSLEPEDRLLGFFVSFVIVKNPANQKTTKQPTEK